MRLWLGIRIVDLNTMLLRRSRCIPIGGGWFRSTRRIRRHIRVVLVCELEYCGTSWHYFVVEGPSSNSRFLRVVCHVSLPFKVNKVGKVRRRQSFHGNASQQKSTGTTSSWIAANLVQGCQMVSYRVDELSELLLHHALERVCVASLFELLRMIFPVAIRNSSRPCQ